MKNKIKNILIKIIKNKATLFVLILLLTFSTWLIVKKQILVKGEINREYFIVLKDDSRHSIIKSSSFDTKTALVENNIKIYPEDKVSEELILDPVLDGGAGQKITIKRAPVYRVNVDDSMKIIRSWGKTINNVLSEKIILGVRDTVVPTLDSPAIPGDIIITRINVVETEEIVVLSSDTVYHNDYYSPSGMSTVLSAGVNGFKINYLRITYKNGAETGRIILGSKTTLAPQSKIIKKGIMPSNRLDFNREYWDMMVDAGTKYRVSPLALYNVASCESHLNPYSQGQYYGMYQYSDGFWQSAFSDAGFSGYNWNSAKAQIYSTAKYVSIHGWKKWGCKP